MDGDAANKQSGHHSKHHSHSHHLRHHHHHHRHHHHNNDFHLDNLHKHFAACLREDGNVDLESYILGYEEIQKFLNLLGTVFGWVSSDVHAKLVILQQHRQSPVGDHYGNVRAMVSYEVKHDMIHHKAKDSNSGTRNLLRLHRALQFITTFLEALPGTDAHEKCCHVAQFAYKDTLARHHPWVVQKAALMAMHMLPTKQGLITKICGDSKEELDAAEKSLKLAVQAMQEVFSRTQEVYAKEKLLDLP